MYDKQVKGQRFVQIPVTGVSDASVRSRDAGMLTSQRRLVHLPLGLDRLLDPRGPLFRLPGGTLDLNGAGDRKSVV